MKIIYRILLFITGSMIISGCYVPENNPDEIAEKVEIQEHHEIIITSSAPYIKLKNIELTEGDGFTEADCVEEVAGNIQYTVLGNIDSNKAGTYKLRYTATDEYGNMTSQTATVTVKEKPAPEPEVVYTPPQQTYTYSQPAYQQPSYSAPAYSEPAYSEPTYSGGATGSSSADATTGQGSVGGMSWNACVAEVARRNSGSCVQIVGTDTYYIIN